MTTKEYDPAQIILMQLGGPNRLKCMIGANSFGAVDGGKALVFRFKSCRKANSVRITLNGLDLYDIEFVKISSVASPKVVETFENIYAEDMRSVFQKFTGLYLAL